MAKLPFGGFCFVNVKRSQSVIQSVKVNQLLHKLRLSKDHFPETNNFNNDFKVKIIGSNK